MFHPSWNMGVECHVMVSLLSCFHIVGGVRSASRGTVVVLV